MIIFFRVSLVTPELPDSAWGRISWSRSHLSRPNVWPYLRSLLDRAAVVRYLSKAEPAMLAEFQKIIDQADMKAGG